MNQMKMIKIHTYKLLFVFFSTFVLGCTNSVSEELQDSNSATNFISSFNQKSFCNENCSQEIFEIKENIISENKRRYTLYVNPELADIEALSAFLIEVIYDQSIFEIENINNFADGRFECRVADQGISCFWLNTISFVNILSGTVSLLEFDVTKKNNLPNSIIVEVQFDGGKYLSVDQKTSDKYIF